MTQSAEPIERLIPDEVSAFCAARPFVTSRNGRALAELHFAPYRHLSLSMETDPETGHRTVVIDVTLSIGVAEVVKRKQAYTREWITVAPPNAREQIRLLYNIV